MFTIVNHQGESCSVAELHANYYFIVTSEERQERSNIIDRQSER